MTSSFQSTAATRIYDSPVNTFVQPVTAIQKTSIMDVAEILQTVNLGKSGKDPGRIPIPILLVPLMLPANK